MDERKKHLYVVLVGMGLYSRVFVVMASNELEAWLDVLLHSREIEVDDKHRVELLEW